MNRYSYPAEVTRDEAGFTLVSFPDVPEAGTDAPDRAAALGEAVDSLACALEGYIEEARPLPTPSGSDSEAIVIANPVDHGQHAAEPSRDPPAPKSSHFTGDHGEGGADVGECRVNGRTEILAADQPTCLVTERRLLAGKDAGAPLAQTKEDTAADRRR